MQHSPGVSFFLFLTSLKATRSGWSRQSLTSRSAKHLRTQAATISLQESLYPLLPTMLSVCWQVPRQQPSRTRTPLLKRRTAPAELWVVSDDSAVRKPNREKAQRISNTLKWHEIKCLLEFSHSSLSFRTQWRKAAPWRSAPVAHGDCTGLVIEERPICSKGPPLNSVDFTNLPVCAGWKGSAESCASACVWRASFHGATRGTRPYA